MTLSVPSFLAAATSAAMPPRSCAEVAVAALLVLPAVLLGGVPQAVMPIDSVAATAAMAAQRRAERFTSSSMKALSDCRNDIGVAVAGGQLNRRCVGDPVGDKASHLT